MSKMWRYIESNRRRYIRKYYRVLRTTIRHMIDPIIEELQYNLDLDSVIDRVPGYFEKSDIKDDIIKLYSETGKFFGENIKQQIVNRKKELNEIDWDEFMANWANNAAGAKVTSIITMLSSDAKKLIRETISQGVADGKGIDEIARMLRDTMPREWDKKTMWKARRIAQTEVIGASNRAGLEAARSFGYEMKKSWLTAPLGISKTERHNLPGSIAERTVMINDKFMVDGGAGAEPMDCPGDAAAGVQNIVNCKCALSYEVL